MTLCVVIKSGGLSCRSCRPCRCWCSCCACCSCCSRCACASYGSFSATRTAPAKSAALATLAAPVGSSYIAYWLKLFCLDCATHGYSAHGTQRVCYGYTSTYLDCATHGSFAHGTQGVLPMEHNKHASRVRKYVTRLCYPWLICSWYTGSATHGAQITYVQGTQVHI